MGHKEVRRSLSGSKGLRMSSQPLRESGGPVLVYGSQGVASVSEGIRESSFLEGVRGSSWVLRSSVYKVQSESESGSEGIRGSNLA